MIIAFRLNHGKNTYMHDLILKIENSEENKNIWNAYMQAAAYINSKGYK